MKKIITTAIFLMAMTSASIAFGQGTGFGGTNNNQIFPVCVTVTATDPTVNMNYTVDHATIKYRFGNTFNNAWDPWATDNVGVVGGGIIDFNKICTTSFTNAEQPVFQYEIHAYSGTTSINSTCGIVDLKSVSAIMATIWDHCGAGTVGFDDPK